MVVHLPLLGTETSSWQAKAPEQGCFTFLGHASPPFWSLSSVTLRANLSDTTTEWLESAEARLIKPLPFSVYPYPVTLVRIHTQGHSALTDAVVRAEWAGDSLVLAGFHPAFTVETNLPASECKPPRLIASRKETVDYRGTLVVDRLTKGSHA